MGQKLRDVVTKLIPALAIAGLLVLPGCQTLRQIAGVAALEFALDRVESPRLAGVDLRTVRSVDDVTPGDMLRLGSALARKELQLDFTLFVAATNPERNTVDARLVGLDWTLFLDDHETINGSTESDLLIAPGTTGKIPTVISLNLLEFFDSSLPDLLNLAKAVTGAGPPQRIKLQATPTVTTVLGPISYPRPITILSREVGG